MAGLRPGVLAIGARVLMEEVAWTVVGLAGTQIHLADASGTVVTEDLAAVCSRGIIDSAAAPPRPSLASGLLPGVPTEAVEEARWWKGHILEVLTGRSPGMAASAPPRPEYDPERRTLAQREAAKAAELTAAGHQGVSARTVNRKRLRFEKRDLAGLVDWRSNRAQQVGGRQDPRVVEATRKAIAETDLASTRSVGFIRWRVQQILDAEHGAGVLSVPPRTTFYDLFNKLARGTHATGSARTRQSQASQPDTPFGVFTAIRPGELMQIDSTPLDVAVRLSDGVIGRVELTGLIDVATRTVTAAVLRPSTKSVDASLLLARTVTPEPMRPGWSEALAMARSVLPHHHMLELDERLAHAAARPVIIPELIVCDQGNVFVSTNFRTACQLLGIDFAPAHAGAPTEKPHIEKMMSSVGSMFAQFVSGYLGSSVEHRGRRPEAEPLWSLMELQELLDEWVVAAWQNRPHDGLRDPACPGRMFTPNEKYASLVQAAGYLPLALSADDYIELLPAKWRAINHYGVKIDHRTYDVLDGSGSEEEFAHVRRQRSGDVEHKGLWEVHYDPYDVTRIWVRNHWDRSAGWFTLFWKHLRCAPMPFGELAWDHALAQRRAQGHSPDEAETAEVVADLLRRAKSGPAGQDREKRLTKRDKRVAARTTAVGPPPRCTDEPVMTRRASEPEDEDTGLAEVIAGDLRCQGGGTAMAVIRPIPEASRETTLTLAGWRRFVSSVAAAFELLPDHELKVLGAEQRQLYDEARFEYHSELAVVATSTVRQVANQGRLLMLLNRREIGARRGMIVSGPQTTGKSTALKQFGLIHELKTRERFGDDGRIPVVYVTCPPKGSPRMLAVEFARFLGLPPIKSRFNVTDIADAVCRVLTEARTDLVLVDEIHNLNLATTAGEDMSDHLKYFTEHIPATFVYAGMDVEHRGLFTGIRGKQIAGRCVLVKTNPFPYTSEWRGLVQAMESTLRLYLHRPGTLTTLDRYLHDRTNGSIGSLAHLVRAGAITAIMDGSEKITRKLLDAIPVDHAAESARRGAA
ncbi:ATP-binding protein [Catenulispora subtropica]|uniref:Integrase catalytic domain-containing protein n=1 Tax=Catenulispora subtropica TaxID=450798 RepID=A0ABN2SWS5_9ACTN